MNVKVLDIQVPAEASDPNASFPVLVLVEIEGASSWFTFKLEPFSIPGTSARIVQADPAMYDRLPTRHRVVHHVCQLVGRAARNGSVNLPQLIAA